MRLISYTFCLLAPNVSDTPVFADTPSTTDQETYILNGTYRIVNVATGHWAALLDSNNQSGVVTITSNLHQGSKVTSLFLPELFLSNGDRQWSVVRHLRSQYKFQSVHYECFAGHNPLPRFGDLVLGADQRDEAACAALGIDRDMSNVRWRPELAAGREPPSWQNSDIVREAGADGMIDRSRGIVGGWHLTLFRWNEPGAPTVSVAGEALPCDYAASRARWDYPPGWTLRHFE